VVVAFADTLFKADFILDQSKDGIIWVQQIEDPRQFGVVKVDAENNITDFVEKPQEFVSDLAIIGIYYFKDGEYLKNEIDYLIDNNITEKGEYQLTNVLENMKAKGTKFAPGQVTEWLDCGNKDATVYTNQRILEYHKADATLVASSARIINSEIIHPCFIGEGVVIENAKIGPHVSIGANSNIYCAIISNSILQNNVKIKDSTFSNSMVGNFAELAGVSGSLSISDYSTITK
jgi:glucose-1-phosphate thymidylyltransferase